MKPQQSKAWRTLAADIVFVGLLTLLVVILAITNRLDPNQWLMWWDNINPELNLALNIKRALFSVWQEYQGLGLVGGMGHAADLPRLLILWLLSFAGVSLNWLRFTWVFGMLWMGIVGTYVFLRSWVLPRAFPSAGPGTHQLGALTGSMFLLTNLATLQMFRTPFEPFITHFGFLPWLTYGFLLIIERPSRRRLLWLSLLTLFSTSQGYVQTVFFVYLAGISIISLTTLLLSRTKQTLKNLIVAWVVILTINAFWLLPTAYFTLTNSVVTGAAKINQMATDEVYLRNQAFGTIWDTIQLKGFWFDTFDFDPQKREMVPILGLWRGYAEQPLIAGIITGLFAIVLVGAVVVLLKKRRNLWWLIGWFAFAIVMLSLDTQPFTWINEQLSRLPLFHQAYRFRFTKVSLFAGFTYSVLFAIGMTWALERMKRWRYGSVGILAGYMVLAGVLAGPMMEGTFIHESAKLTIPKQYFELYSFFDKQPKAARIANLPQPTYWGWQYYDWGYTGWGFLWYGIQQPILDRAFDPWSGYNENYYWEISRSIYSKDAQSLSDILDKYDVRYVLLDEHVLSPSHNRALFIEEIKAMLASLPEIKEVARFGKLTVYERVGNDTKKFISIKKNLPTVSPTYGWTDNDVAFTQLGDYVSLRSNELTNNEATFIYPFRSLFTKRSVDEREFRITETEDAITIGSTVEATGSSILKADTLVYDSTKSADLVAENVKLCGVLREGEATAQTVDQFLRFTSRNQRGCLSFGVGNLPHRDGYLVSVESRHITGRPMLFSLINQTAKHVELETYLTVRGHPERAKRVEGSPEWQTSYFILPPLATDGLGYTVYLSNDAIGRQETINDIKSIKFYRIPYQELVSMRRPPGEVTNNETTLVFSQSFDPGWFAFTKTPTFPFVTPLQDHVLVNNWANGWRLPAETDESTIVLFFLPQLLEWFGFLLLPIPFLIVYLKKI